MFGMSDTFSFCQVPIMTTLFFVRYRWSMFISNNFVALLRYFYSLTHSLTQTLTNPLTHSLIHSLAHSPVHSLIYSLSHSIIHPLTHSPTHSLTHSHTHLNLDNKQLWLYLNGVWNKLLNNWLSRYGIFVPFQHIDYHHLHNLKLQVLP